MQLPCQWTRGNRRVRIKYVEKHVVNYITNAIEIAQQGEHPSQEKMQAQDH